MEIRKEIHKKTNKNQINMKKKIALLGILCLTILSSCKKEEEEIVVPPYTGPNAYEDCNCGYITDDDIWIDDNWNSHYTLTILNNCTGNLGTWEFTYGVWLHANVGEFFCVSNVPQWMPVPGMSSHNIINKDTTQLR